MEQTIEKELLFILAHLGQRILAARGVGIGRVELGAHVIIRGIHFDRVGIDDNDLIWDSVTCDQ